MCYVGDQKQLVNGEKLTGNRKELKALNREVPWRERDPDLHSINRDASTPTGLTKQLLFGKRPVTAGFRPHSLDRMCFLHYDNQGVLDCMALVYVDDFLVTYADSFNLATITSLFKWGNTSTDQEVITLKGKQSHTTYQVTRQRTRDESHLSSRLITIRYVMRQLQPTSTPKKIACWSNDPSDPGNHFSDGYEMGSDHRYVGRRPREGQRCTEVNVPQLAASPFCTTEVGQLTILPQHLFTPCNGF